MAKLVMLAKLLLSRVLSTCSRSATTPKMPDITTVRMRTYGFARRISEPWRFVTEDSSVTFLVATDVFPVKC